MSGERPEPWDEDGASGEPGEVWTTAAGVILNNDVQDELKVTADRLREKYGCSSVLVLIGNSTDDNGAFRTATSGNYVECKFFAREWAD